MRFEHAGHPGRGVRLAYCLNLHPAEDLAGVLAGLRAVTLPLAARFRPAAAAAGPRVPFGIGPWWSAALAAELAQPASPGRERLAGFLAAHALEPFTANAFPFGGFHRAGLKERVFEPAWSAPERLRFTADVARVLLALARSGDGPAAAAARASHLSLSTHAGGFGGADAHERARRAAGLADAARLLRRLSDESGLRLVLGLEPEPRSHANDTGELAPLFEEIQAVLDASGDADAAAHLGTCLDTCHAAVEFEDEAGALRRATDGRPLAKLQFTSALALPRPAADDAGRAALFAMHEPVFLHQVSARHAAGIARARDLDEAARAFDEGRPGWREADEWRCHFHVPVDRASLAGTDASASALRATPGPAGAAGGLATTLASAERLLALALAAPERWGTRELHVEIETYTWSVLAGRSGPARAALPEALAREVAHVHALLAAHGWSPST